MIILGHFSSRLNPDKAITDLYENGEDGIWVAPRYTNSMFQDAGGTIPWTTNGQPVGRLLDLSGNNHHLIQSTTTARPLGYSDKIVGDGVDDYMTAGNVLDMGPNGFLVGVVFQSMRTSGAGIVNKAPLTSEEGRYMIRLNSGITLYTGSPVYNFLNYSTSVLNKYVVIYRVNRIEGVGVTRVNGVHVRTIAFTPNATPAYNSGNFQIMLYDFQSERFKGDFMEMAFVLKNASEEEAIRLESRLASLHGIALP